MATVPIIGGGGTNMNGGSNFFQSLGNKTSRLTATVEAEEKTRYRVAGTFSKLIVYVAVNNNTTGSTSVKLRKNGANGNTSISISSATTGEFTDGSNTDTIASGDDVCLYYDNSTGDGLVNFQYFTILFAASSNTVTKLIQNGYTSISADSTANEESLVGFGGGIGSTDVTRHKQKISTAGTLKKLNGYVVTNGRITTCNLRTKINAANGNQDISLTASTTGFFEDASNTDVIASGDYANFEVNTQTGGGSLVISIMAVEFETTNAQTIVAFNGYDGGASVDHGVTNYGYLSGSSITSTEANAKIKLQVTALLSKLVFRTNFNSCDGASTVAVRQNTSTSVVTTSVTASTTGEFTDVTHSFTIAATDYINYIFIGGGASGTMSVDATTLLIDTTSGTTSSTTITTSSSTSTTTTSSSTSRTTTSTTSTSSSTSSSSSSSTTTTVTPMPTLTDSKRSGRIISTRGY